MKKAGTLSPEGFNMTLWGAIHSAPQPWVLPRVIGTRAKENQMQIAQKESEHQVNKKFNRSEKKWQHSGLPVGCFRRFDKLAGMLCNPHASMWVLGGHRIGPSHPNIHSVSSAHGWGVCLPAFIFDQAGSELPHPARKAAQIWPLPMMMVMMVIYIIFLGSHPIPGSEVGRRVKAHFMEN